MKTHAFRLTEGKALREEIEKYARKHKIKAGIVLSCVGSLNRAAIRMAGAKVIKIVTPPSEIMSLTGTLGVNGSHLHLSIADKNGQVLGGHLKEGSIVRTTAEIVIGEIENTQFKRKIDPSTGFDELEITKD